MFNVMRCIDKRSSSNLHDCEFGIGFFSFWLSLIKKVKSKTCSAMETFSLISMTDTICRNSSMKNKSIACNNITICSNWNSAPSPCGTETETPIEYQINSLQSNEDMHKCTTITISKSFCTFALFTLTAAANGRRRKKEANTIEQIYLSDSNWKWMRICLIGDTLRLGRSGCKADSNHARREQRLASI